jgi:undecaprenyl-diphosphatase
MSTLEAVIIAIVEGITEFLPVSSTGHMIITSSLIGVDQTADFPKLFEVVIQLGAILAVVVFYYKKFFDVERWQFYLKLIVAVIPALIFGALFSKRIKGLMESNLTVAVSFLLGGIVLLFIDNIFKRSKAEQEQDITYPKAFTIGLWQVMAMIPGVSRSAASIIGGMQQGLSRKLAAEFSFFLAVPTMFAATAKDLLDWYKEKGSLGSSEAGTLLLGSLVAFIVALAAIKFFISYLQKYGFRLFGYYRIIAGIILLILIYNGYIHG